MRLAVIKNRFSHVAAIEKGWSGEEKYCAVKEDGEKVLMRTSGPESWERKQLEFCMMQEAEKRGVPMCRPLDTGLCEDGVWALHSWVEGEILEEQIDFLPDTEQYVLGLKAGAYLRKIHAIPAPDGQPEWEKRFNGKIDRKIALYRECPIQLESGEGMIRYLNAHRGLLKNRPQSLQHGDYHLGNMMLEGETLSIIDFNRFDFGDPWEEFNRIVWCAQKSPIFASAILRGYFGGEPPEEFWQLLTLYIYSNTLSAVPWAIPFGQKDVEVMVNQAAEVAQWYAGREGQAPSWYVEPLYLQEMDGCPFKLKAPFNFDFLSRWGRVFKVFDDQDSGNICFGMEKDGERFFVKFAGAPTERYTGTAADAVLRLRESVPLYRELAHENLIAFVEELEIGGGYAAVFRWVEGVCMGRMYPEDHRRFTALPLETKQKIFREILDFHRHVAEQGYVAVDFYDGSVMYDFGKNKTLLCDIDFYQKRPYVNTMGRLWGSSRYMAPEEFSLGADIDEVTNVYTMGAMAFALFADYSREEAGWPLNEKSYAVVKRAVAEERKSRQQSIGELATEWEAAI